MLFGNEIRGTGEKSGGVLQDVVQAKHIGPRAGVATVWWREMNDSRNLLKMEPDLGLEHSVGLNVG